MKFNTFFLAWITFALALLAWVGVVFFSLTIQNMSQQALALQASAQAAIDQQSSALQEHQLAGKIASARTEFETVLQQDPLALVNIITTAGKDASTTLQVSDASPENSSMPLSDTNSSGIPQVTAIDFTLQANGTFSSLVRTISLLEVLPVPSSINEFDLTSVPNAPSGRGHSWHMDAQLRALTTSSLSL